MNGVKMLVAATLLGVAGCSGDDNSATKVQPRTAPAVLEAVKQDLIDRDTGRYESHVFLEKTSFTSDEGQYILSSDSFRAVRSTDVPQGSFTTNVRVIGDDLYMQMRDWPEPMTGCWLAFTRSELETFAGMAGAEEPGPVGVATVLAAGDAEFASRHEDALRVTVPAYLGLQMFQLSGRILVDLPDISDERVPAVLEVGAGRVTSLRLDGPKVQAALDRSGVDVPATLRRGLEIMNVDIGFGSAESVRVAAPDKTLVVRGDAGMERGCR